MHSTRTCRAKLVLKLRRFAATSPPLLPLRLPHKNMSPAGRIVLVSGAGGQLGSIVVNKLLQSSQAYDVRALVRSEGSSVKLDGRLGPNARNARPHVFCGDIMDPSSLTGPMQDARALIITTSAAAKLDSFALSKMYLAKMMGDGEAKMKYSYPPGGSPEAVDWVGQKNQIDAAVACGVEHVVLVGGMGGTRPAHFLNRIGDGNILIWKRKAEEFLMASGLSYTIIHAGEPADFEDYEAPGGERQLFVATDDALLDDKDKNAIPREDVAEVCVQSLHTPAALNRSFDLGSAEPGIGEAFKSLDSLLGELGGRNCTTKP